MATMIALVDERIPQKDMSKLYELSPKVSDVLKEWLDDPILDSFGDQTWIDMRRRMDRTHVRYCDELVRRPGGEEWEGREGKKAGWMATFC